MSGWLESGRRRDVCVVLHGTGGLRGQQVKARLEDRYDGRIDPSAFYGAVERLVETGHVEERTEGIHDVYALTDAGERALEDHYEWVRSELDAEAE